MGFQKYHGRQKIPSVSDFGGSNHATEVNSFCDNYWWPFLWQKTKCAGGQFFFFEEVLLLTLQKVTDVSIGASNPGGVS